MSIPNRLNVILVLALQGAMLASLALASQLGWVWAIPIGMVVSFGYLTNYALMHEAAHGSLHATSWANRFFGTLSGLLFPVSHTFLTIVHKVHHNSNRTDHEMFDYYYPSDNLLIKRAQWYSILTGIYPPIIPMGSFLMAFAPWFFQARPFAHAKSSSILFADNQFQAEDIRKIRTEVLFGILYWFVAWKVFSLRWLPVLIVYACCWFNWSTRQYVTHAFSPRDVMTGAWNLKVSPLMSWLLLRGEWDQVHHMHPETPWRHLPKFAASTSAPIPYWRQYLSLWKGPRPNVYAPPQPIR